MNLRAQKVQKRTLQAMLAVAMGLLVWGLVRLRLDGVTHADAVAAFAEISSMPLLVVKMLRAEPVALLAAGIAVIVVTPAVRLVLLAIDFLAQRDWLYAAMSAVVGAIVTVAFFLRVH